LALDKGAVPTQWGVAFDRFAGIAALGGGALVVTAGGDIENLTLAIPTTGRTVAGAVDDPVNPSRIGVALETTEIAGGGQMRIRSDGDIHDSLFYLGDGSAEVVAGGDADAGAAGTATSIIAGGAANFRLLAGGDLAITAAKDPGMVEISDTQGISLGESAEYFGNAFFTYLGSASVDLQVLAGDVVLSGTSGDANALAPVFTVASHSGDLRVTENIIQYPSRSGQLQLLAANDVIATTGITPIRVEQSDQDVSLLPDIQYPDGSISDAPDHAEIPVHLGDERVNLVVARAGSITTTGVPFWGLSLAKATHLEAGQDINNVSAKVQNNQAGDITSLIAGRDILQRTQRDPTTGAFLSFVEDSERVSQFEIAGPGSAEFIAGRSITLGTSDGIETVGNSKNRFLVDGGADLILMAGLGGEPDYDAFIQTYLVGGVSVETERGTSTRVYDVELADYLDERGIDSGVSDPVTAFQSLQRREQRPLLSRILFSELLASGVYAQESASQDYSRGFAAIATLFPGNDPAGGISMLLSQVQTLDGGDIAMLVPGGLINAGAANSDIIDKGASELGVVAARAGDIDIFVDNDLLVNSTRVFALQGDLLVWSSNGSIDAGKGAKTVSSIPEPVATIGPTGEILIEFPPAVEGSGLQGSNAFLFAPRGVINAGDAGIRTAGNLTLGATEVLGADNIDVGGVSVGVPVSNSSASGLAGVNNVASATSGMMDDSADSLGDQGGDTAGRETDLGILSVEVVGFGECAADDPSCT
ncbi:MAG: filamentous hemagglutinin family protein, partial [Gammaproteobacteria bacterium]